MPRSQRGSSRHARMGPCHCQLYQNTALANGQHAVPHAAGVQQAYAARAWAAQHRLQTALSTHMTAFDPIQ